MGTFNTEWAGQMSMLYCVMLTGIRIYTGIIIVVTQPKQRLRDVGTWLEEKQN